MTSALWLDVPVERVRLDELVFSQEQLSIAGLLGHAGGATAPKDLPHVVVFEGRRYVDDGHHRVTLALLRGEEELSARVLYR